MVPYLMYIDFGGFQNVDVPVIILDCLLFGLQVFLLCDEALLEVMEYSFDVHSVT